MNGFLQRRDELRNMMAKLNAVMTRCQQDYDRFVKATETFEIWFEVFDSESMLEIYRRYDEVSVDTVSLDHDHQNLLETWQPIIFAEREYFEKAERVDTSYGIITERTDFLFEDIDMVEDDLRELYNVGKSGIINIQYMDDGEYRAF